ncbi:MAG: endonuclease/exonuclease/phosphatase family protein [Muribaculaceae bacterium]|nr:endonuclease/exonuclease/phosphatase family protein [Muribaculaceae bacterium]
MKTILYILAWLVNVACAAGMLLSAYAYMIPPEKWLYAPVLAMTFPVWAAVMVVLLILDLIFWRWVAILAGLVIVACWGPLGSTCPINIPKGSLSEKEEERAFTLMTYNVAKFHDIDTAYARQHKEDKYSRQMECILEVQPDIVCVQELQEGGTEVAISKEQNDSLYAAYPYVYVRRPEFGLLSKYPVEVVNIDFPTGDFKSGDISCWRVNVHDRVLNIFSVHLCSIDLADTTKVAYQDMVEMDGVSRGSIGELRQVAIPNIQAAAIIRAQQIDLLISYLRKYGGENTIVCGDFNDVENSYAVRRLQSQADLKQAWGDVGLGPLVTYFRYDLFFHIDHILYRGDMKPHSIRLDRIKASDHYPQIATFVFDKR